jgi:hypothetical protein
MMILRRRIPAYARQIVSQSDTARLEAVFCGACHTQAAKKRCQAFSCCCRCIFDHFLPP